MTRESETLSPEEQMEAYGEAVKSGMYAKRSGLVGKYDNVRRYWEDEITRINLRPFLARVLDHCQTQMRRLRIMDVGCGSADGYELLAGVRQRDADLRCLEVDFLTPDTIGQYLGVDLSEDLLEQAQGIYGHNPKMHFRQADFTQGLPLENGEDPYDLYFASYGTWSHHNDDETAIRLLAEIASHTQQYAVVMCDWLGRYSYEWQTLWTNDFTENRNMDYVVSYIYEKEEREARRDELQHLNLRLMSRQEVEDIVAAASKRAGVAIRPLKFFDRSILTGRHLDTGDYNPHAQPLRRAINSLHEINCRTDLTEIVFDYVPKEGFPFVNQFFEHLQMCWNILVKHTQHMIDTYSETQGRFTEEPVPPPASYPPVLREAMDRMRAVVQGVGWLPFGMPRENIIEPQLGYALRNLVMHLEQGQGCGHGLVGIFEIEKR